jgi:hypothetical protein
VGKDVNNKPTYRMVPNSDNTLPTVAYKKSNTLGDVWQMQLGVRYTFN